MIEQWLFQKHIVGRDGFIWWIGQIASDSWKDNWEGSQPENITLSDNKGFEMRYQVRIMGYHTANPEALPDEDLPWAGVMYPVTAGAQAGSSGATPNLQKGNFVYGFFLDGEDAQQPIIMGVLGYNQYTSIYKDNGKIPPFVPFLGYTTTGNEGVIPTNTLKADPASDDELAPGALEGTTPATKLIKQGQSASQASVADEKKKKHGSKMRSLETPYSCKKNSQDVKGVALIIKNMRQDIEGAQKGLKEWKAKQLNPLHSSVTEEIQGVQEYINQKIKDASEQVTAAIIPKIKDMQKWIMKKIESAMKKVYFMMYPAQQLKVGEAADSAMDLLSCHFKRIINNLFKLVFKALKGIVDRWINVPTCAAESIVGALMGKLMGLVNGITNSIMGPIDALFGAIGQAVDIVGSAMEFLDDILSFLSCETEPQCPEVKEWSAWLASDPQSSTIDAQNLVGKIKQFAGGVSDVINPDSFDFDGVDFSDIFELNDCDTNPIQCGPPIPVFWGGSGSDASGNAIVSAAGDIIGVDIINSGYGYFDKRPFLTFKDDCGHGQNGTGIPVIGPVYYDDLNQKWLPDPDRTIDPNSAEWGVTGVDITSSGFGYLQTPDGSQGGDGRVWADFDQTVVLRGGEVLDDGVTLGDPDKKGTWDIPYGGGDLISALRGDSIRAPIGCKTQFFATDGKTYEVFGGSYFIAPSEGVLTAPAGCATQSPQKGDYPAILYVCSVAIVNPGFSYQPGDKVVIEPDVGAEITPTFDSFGSLVGVELIRGGEGFTEFPTIYIESDTGFNAEIRARLCIDRVTDELKIPEIQDKIVSVVDCVGTV